MPHSRHASTPEDWPRAFTEHVNAGDLEAVVALYDADARFVARSGETIVGREQMREVLRGLIDAKTRLQAHVVRAVTLGDVALLYSDFDGTTLDASGRQTELHHRAIEVLRRQPDGAWTLIFGDPSARAGEKG